MQSNRTALTLIELLVVIAVIGVLIGLTLVGVQHAREVARRSQCTNNLKQIAVAILNYESASKQLPLGNNYGLSYLVSILPYMEQQPLYADITQKHSANSNYYLNVDDQVSGFVCPSDPQPTLKYAVGSYAGNTGVWALSTGFNGVFIVPQLGGMFKHADERVTTSSILDGLSTTAMCAEMIHADGRKGNLMSANWDLPRKATQIDELVELCERSHTNIPDMFARGYPWTIGDVGYNLYNHVNVPDSVSCYNFSSVPEACISTSSRHRSAVNFVFADGHVTNLSKGVDLKTYRALGSRNSVDE